MSPGIAELDKIAISVKSHKLLKKLLKENPKLEEIMINARNETEPRMPCYEYPTYGFEPTKQITNLQIPK